MAEWYSHANESARQAKLDPHYVFVQTDGDDSLDDLVFRDNVTIVSVDEPLFQERNWGADRYTHMVNLRNTLLSKVRDISPDLFLSLDSDVLVNPMFLKSSLERDSWDAVGGKVYLSKARKEFLSYAKLSREGALIRPDSDGFFKTDVLMAVKLMRRSAYNTDYKFDKRGEDIGWSLNCKDKGLSLYWNGMFPSKHVFLPEKIGDYDDRVGY